VAAASLQLVILEPQRRDIHVIPRKFLSVGR